jgi:predicted Zn-ribbon and HTH transcriptional regulator
MHSNDIEQQRLGGARRKNGHKPSCACHICENMKYKAKRKGYSMEAELARQQKLGLTQKHNGHRQNCRCPICKNMSRKSKRRRQTGGNEEDTRMVLDSDDSYWDHIDNPSTTDSNRPSPPSMVRNPLPSMDLLPKIRSFKPIKESDLSQWSPTSSESSSHVGDEPSGTQSGDHQENMTGDDRLKDSKMGGCWWGAKKRTKRRHSRGRKSRSYRRKSNRRKR